MCEMELSFGEILKNQKKTVIKKVKNVKNLNDKRYSDEAPEEISSKRPNKIKHHYERNYSIDPRFSERCGKYNEEKFRANFQHAFELRDQELDELKKKKAKDKDQKTKNLVQKMENQKREYAKKKSKIQSKPAEVKYYPNKRKQRAEELLTKFKELKSSGGLEKYLDKKRKKESSKSRKKMNIEKE